MSKHSRSLSWFITAAAFGFALFLFGSYLLREDYELSRCADLERPGLQVNCAFELIAHAMDEGGLPEAFEVFANAYERVPAIAQTGCHRYSHRMGDLAYYRLYVPTQDIADIDFIQETTACGYGFFHGLLEHVVQNRPDPAFVIEVCDKLTRELADTMRDIRPICYHGSGHGFGLIQAERVPPERWGNVEAFTAAPLASCDALPGISHREIEECREGVFNMLVDWMETKQYGFSYDRERPFKVCDALPDRTHHRACYYEMAMKLDSVSGYDVGVLLDIVKAASPEFGGLAFSVGIAGLMQHVASKEGGYRTAFTQCFELEPEWYEPCAESLVNGLFEHGAPQKEYLRALELCAEPLLAADERRQEACYGVVGRRLMRFYAPERSAQICSEFPREYRDGCRSAIAHKPMVE